MIVLEDTPIDRDSLRLRNEFLEMPGLAVNVSQTARLFGIRLDRAADMLERLEREGFLMRDVNGAFRRRPRA